MRKYLLLILFVIVTLFVTTFSTKNPDPVTVNYFGLPGGSYDIKLWLLVLGVFVLGLVVGALFYSLSIVKAKTQLARTKRKLARHEEELAVHAPPPVRNDPI